MLEQLVKDFPPNKEPGFIRDPKKGKGIDMIHPAKKLRFQPTHCGPLSIAPGIFHGCSATRVSPMSRKTR